MCENMEPGTNLLVKKKYVVEVDGMEAVEVFANSYKAADGLLHFYNEVGEEFYVVGLSKFQCMDVLDPEEAEEEATVTATTFQELFKKELENDIAEGDVKSSNLAMEKFKKYFTTK